MTMFIIGAVLFAWGMYLVLPWDRTDKPALVTLQAKKAQEEADKAKRAPGRLTAALLLILLGLGLALGGIFSSPGSGQCNAQGQCQQFGGTP
jgi:hypothetical protein